MIAAKADLPPSEGGGSVFFSFLRGEASGASRQTWLLLPVLFSLPRGGGVREVGSHDELMALQGRYYRMWQAQAQYYQEDQKMHDYLRERQQA